MSTFASSEDPDEMQYNAAFHQGLQFLQWYNAVLQGLHCLQR